MCPLAICPSSPVVALVAFWHKLHSCDIPGRYLTFGQAVSILLLLSALSFCLACHNFLCNQQAKFSAGESSSQLTQATSSFPGYYKALNRLPSCLCRCSKHHHLALGLKSSMLLIIQPTCFAHPLLQTRLSQLRNDMQLHTVYLDFICWAHPCTRLSLESDISPFVGDSSLVE